MTLPRAESLSVDKIVVVLETTNRTTALEEHSMVLVVGRWQKSMIGTKDSFLYINAAIKLKMAL